MTANNSQRATCGTELSATMTGSWVLIGALPQVVSHIIFDNQGTSSVAISTNGGTTTWRTFTPGEAIVLDIRAAHASAPNFAFDQNTAFYGNGSSGTFSISYIYAQG